MGRQALIAVFEENFEEFGLKILLLTREVVVLHIGHLLPCECLEQLLNFILTNHKVKQLVNFHLLSVLQVHFLELMLDLALKSE